MKFRKTVQCEVCGKTTKRFVWRKRRGYILCKKCKKELKTSGVVCFDDNEEGED